MAATPPPGAPEWVIIISAISGIGSVVISAFAAVHNFGKDRSRDARRSYVLEQTKERLEIWNVKTEISGKILSGDALDVDRSKALAASERIMRDANDALQVLSGPRWWKRTVPKVGLFRTLFLRFDVPEGLRSRARAYRIVYYFYLGLAVLGWAGAIAGKVRNVPESFSTGLLYLTLTSAYVMFLMWWSLTHIGAEKIIPPQQV